VALIDNIKNFYTYGAFQNMESPYKRGYQDAEKKGILNEDQKDWAHATLPPTTWDPAEEALLRGAITSAFDAMRSNNAPMDADVRKFKADLINPNGMTIAKILETFQEKPEKLEIILSYIGIDNPDIADAIYSGLNAVDYKTGKNKIIPKYRDKKNLFMEGIDAIKEFGSDYFGKYFSKSARKNMPGIARTIFDEIEAAKIKPTNGLKGLLEKSEEIQKKLPAAAEAQFKIIITALKSLSHTDHFAKALKSGRAMRALIEDLAEYGSENEKAFEGMKQLQFILHGLSYGPNTSSIRGKLKENPLTLFSDPRMSWNKNEGLRFMARATDKVLNLGFMAVFNIANYAKNKIRQGTRSEFSSSSEMVKDAVPGYRTDMAEATAARAAATAATATGDPNAADLDRIAEKKERGGPGYRKLLLLAHWNLIKSYKTSNFALGSHKKAEKEYHSQGGQFDTDLMKELKEWAR